MILPSGATTTSVADSELPAPVMSVSTVPPAPNAGSSAPPEATAAAEAGADPSAMTRPADRRPAPILRVPVKIMRHTLWAVVPSGPPRTQSGWRGPPGGPRGGGGRPGLLFFAAGEAAPPPA